MKLLTITIRPLKIGDRAVGWFAEISAIGETDFGGTIFHRSTKRQVQKLVARLKNGDVEIRSI